MATRRPGRRTNGGGGAPRRARHVEVEAVIVEEIVEDDGDGEYEDEEEEEVVDGGGAVIEELDEEESAATRADRTDGRAGGDGEEEEEEGGGEPENDVDDFDPAKETIAQRLYALKDIIPVNRRRQLQDQFSRAVSAGRMTYAIGGVVAWALATTFLVVVLPLGVELEYEQAAIAWENEMRAQQEQAQQLLTPADGLKG